MIKKGRLNEGKTMNKAKILQERDRILGGAIIKMYINRAMDNWLSFEETLSLVVTAFTIEQNYSKIQLNKLISETLSYITLVSIERVMLHLSEIE